MRRVGLVCALAALLIQGAGAGELDNFEEQAGKKDKKDSSSSGKSKGSRSYYGGPGSLDDDDDSLFETLVFGFFSTPVRFWLYDPMEWYSRPSYADTEDWTVEGIPDSRHWFGEAALPFVRADWNWQYISSDLDAADVRLEAGYKMLAFHGRYTRYEEDHPSDALTFNQFYGVVRAGGAVPEGARGSRLWEIGLGFGGVEQKGNEDYSSFAFTAPIKVYPTDWLGIEFKPAWYKPQERMIGDYDLSASVGWRYVQLRGGYRWLTLQGEGSWLDGPYAGVSLSF